MSLFMEEVPIKSRFGEGWGAVVVLLVWGIVLSSERRGFWGFRIFVLV